MRTTTVVLALAVLALAQVAIATAAPKCTGGRLLHACKHACEVTCQDKRPVQRAECDKLVCAPDASSGGGFCVCPGHMPVWNEKEKRCTGFNECEDAIIHHVKAEGKCKALTCNSKERPWRCPPGSKVGTPIDANGCSGCPTCITDDNKAVEVPLCWRVHAACKSSKCGLGEMARMVQRAGKGGQAPCCHQFECVPVPSV